MNEITLTRPDDWHLHLRDGEALQAVVPATARQMGRAIIMPNLRPPVTSTEQALAYRERILAARPVGSAFEPLMTLYLTDRTPADEIERAVASGYVHAVKLYPAGATTNSDSGVTDLAQCDGAIAAMARLGMPLLVHGEVTDAHIDIFDREAVFIERIMKPLLERHPDLKVVFEHITTTEAATFVAEAPANVAATITAHHLLFNRNHMLAGGIRPHYYCLPILKRERHREALLAAATSGSGKFFLGTDSAPHAKETRSLPAAAPAPTRLRQPSSFMPRRSNRQGRWTSWRALRAITARTSTVCRAIGIASPWCARRGRCRSRCLMRMDR